MNRKAFAVIGMNYGDEGKGHITNYFSSENSLTIRFNGGAQARHTVHTSTGLSHIFSHFGSGSLKGARTLLGCHFIVNPLILFHEAKYLSEKVNIPNLFIDPRCRVTTPFDMLLNELNSNYHKRKDSCGVGINETVERNAYRQLSINMKDFFEKSDKDLLEILDKIYKEYIPFRIRKLNIPKEVFDRYFKDRNLQQVSSAFIELRSWMKSSPVAIWNDDEVVDKFLSKSKERYLVFEGAQGMLLDQNRKERMPYLTRSSTGIKNILSLLKTVKTPIDLETFLITRCYLTRHGDGPIENYHPKPFERIEDETNLNNRFQGELRFGYLNMEWYNKAIQETEEAIQKSSLSLNSYSVNTAMTCIDHIGNNLFLYSKDDKNTLIDGDFKDFKNLKLISSGKNEKDIKENL